MEVVGALLRVKGDAKGMEHFGSRSLERADPSNR
jgi:hypothetical protein